VGECGKVCNFDLAQYRGTLATSETARETVATPENIEKIKISRKLKKIQENQKIKKIQIIKQIKTIKKSKGNCVMSPTNVAASTGLGAGGCSNGRLSGFRTLITFFEFSSRKPNAGPSQDVQQATLNTHTLSARPKNTCRCVLAFCHKDL